MNVVPHEYSEEELRDLSKTQYGILYFRERIADEVAEMKLTKPGNESLE